MLALHSSDPVTVYLSMFARSPELKVGDTEHALYERRSLVRFYGMRRTLWVVEREMVPVVHHSTTRRLGERERARHIRLIEEAGIAEDGAAWLDEHLPLILEVLARRGPTLGRDLTKEIPALEHKITFRNKAGRVTATAGMTTRALTQLALESRIVRARPAGSWISGQYRWAETGDWLGDPIADVDPQEASARLVARWLTTFGPATEDDLRWWTGWSLGQLRQALSRVGAVEVSLEEGTGLLLPDDEEPVEVPPRWVALLPSLDPTTMGWKQRRWYLDGLEAELFDRSGNAGQTVWVDGRVVGGWAQRKEGELVYELLDDVGSEAVDMIESKLAALGDWLGPARFTCRFRSNLDRRLMG